MLTKIELFKSVCESHDKRVGLYQDMMRFFSQAIKEAIEQKNFQTLVRDVNNINEKKN